MGKQTEGCRGRLSRYLLSWGLRSFSTESEYYQWQHESLSPEELQSLQQLVAKRQGGQNEAADEQFYDFLAQPHILPILYSQRYQYFLTLGDHLFQRICSADRVLDFGCGVGILTLFLAQEFPAIQFVGVDRSEASLIVARQEAKRRGILNVRFEVKLLGAGSESPAGECFDLILSSQVLLQAEQEPGLPSNGWETFERLQDPVRQELLEKRTGLHVRLNTLLGSLHPEGRMVLFEKTWNLGRRVFFQRALASRGLGLIYPPLPCVIDTFQEREVDGPLFEVRRYRGQSPVSWGEDPPFSSGETLHRCGGENAKRLSKSFLSDQSLPAITKTHHQLGTVTWRFGRWQEALLGVFCEKSGGMVGAVIGGMVDKPIFLELWEKVQALDEAVLPEMLEDFWGEGFEESQEGSAPCYENHRPSAQQIFESLPEKWVDKEYSSREGEGRQCHIELGRTLSFTYLYWANTFDQRQIVLIDHQRETLLREYYEESLTQIRLPPA